MQVTVNIPDELAAQALANGSSPEKYVEELIALRTIPPPEKRPTKKEFEEALDGLAQFSDKTPDLPIEAFRVPAFMRITIESARFAIYSRSRKRMLAVYNKRKAAAVSNKRGLCVWLGFGILAVITIFPPWALVRFAGPNYTSIQRIKLWHSPVYQQPIRPQR